MGRSSERITRSEVGEIAHFLEQEGCREVVALDVRAFSSITDFHIIAEASSVTRLRGLYRQVSDLLQEKGLSVRQRPSRGDESGWILLDCEEVVVHLMLSEQRSFYELEKLWFEAELIYSSEKSE